MMRFVVEAARRMRWRGRRRVVKIIRLKMMKVIRITRVRRMSGDSIDYDLQAPVVRAVCISSTVRRGF